MKMLTFGIVLCFAAVPVSAGSSPFSDTRLTEMNQNLAFRPKLLNSDIDKRPASSHSFKLAKVHFVVDKSDTIGFDDINQSFDHNDAQRCKDLGFSLTAACAATQFKSRLCPYDNAYYDRCCDNDFKYAKAECSYPNTISSTSCGGKYKCYCDTSLYPYTTSNCPAPKELSDKCVDSSGSHYAECKCPITYQICSSTQNLIGVGNACIRGGESLYASCQCKSGYNMTCLDYGAQNPSDFCFLNGNKYYKNCKSAADWCIGMGYDHSSENPCGADQVINNVCPKNNSFYNCTIDRDKYCQNNGFTREACTSYQDAGGKCPYDSTYHKCTHTCKSRIYAALGGKVNFDGFNTLSGSDIPMVYTQNSTDDINTTRGGIYRSNKSYNYTECQNLPVPVVTTRNATGSSLGGVDLRDFELHYKVSSSSALIQAKGNITLAGMTVKPCSTGGSIYDNDLKIENITASVGVNLNILPGNVNEVTDISAFDIIYLNAAAIKVKNNAALKARHIHFSTWADFIMESGAKTSSVASLYLHGTSNSEVSIAQGTILNVTGELAWDNEYSDLPELRSSKIGILLGQPNGQGEASGAPILLRGKINLTNNMAIYSGNGGSTFYIGPDAHFYFNDIYMQNNGGIAIDHVGSTKSGCMYSSKWGKSIKANSDNDYCGIYGKNSWLVSGGGAPWNGSGASWNGICNYTAYNRCN